MTRKVIIAGGRDFGHSSTTDDEQRVLTVENQREMGYNALWSIFQRATTIHFDAWTIVSGTARGADHFGEEFAKVWGIQVAQFPAAWDEHGKSAGHRRNYDMAVYADVLIAFWDGESKGTRGMIDTALREGLEIHVYRY